MDVFGDLNRGCVMVRMKGGDDSRLGEGML